MPQDSNQLLFIDIFVILMFPDFLDSEFVFSKYKIFVALKKLLKKKDGNPEVNG